MIKSLNLSLTSKCSANCIFCPNDRGECNTTDTMSAETLETVIKQAKDLDIKQVIIGENGDVFLHEFALRTLRLVRDQLPKAKIVLFTNFLSVTADQMQAIVKDKLVDVVICNIDSILPEQYKLAKNADFFKMWENFTGFLMWRLYYRMFNDITMEINIVDPVMYNKTLHNSFPNITGVTVGKDNTKLTCDFLKFMVHDKDTIKGILPCFWAERDKVKGYLKNNWCPQMGRVETEAFISPDGTWYACCLDSKNELRLGNIHEQHLKDIATGEKRKKLIQQLKDGKFEEIGMPCLTVACCHSYKLGGEKHENSND